MTDFRNYDKLGSHSKPHYIHKNSRICRLASPHRFSRVNVGSSQPSSSRNGLAILIMAIFHSIEASLTSTRGFYTILYTVQSLNTIPKWQSLIKADFTVINRFSLTAKTYLVACSLLCVSGFYNMVTNRLIWLIIGHGQTTLIWRFCI